MTVVERSPPAHGATPRTSQRSIHAVDAEHVGAVWDALAAKGGSAYQSRAFLEPWIAHVAPALGIAPSLGIVRDGLGEPVALLPFGTVHRWPLKTVVYLGGRDSNLNMPLFDPGSDLPGDDDATTLLRAFAKTLSPRPDLFILANQPRTWMGRRNPFAFAHASLSPSAAFGGTLGSDIEAFLAARQSRDSRKKLRGKATRLATLGPVVFEKVSPADAPVAVATFIAQKQERLSARGIDAGLSGPHVRAFLTALACPHDGAPALDLYALRVGDTIAAVFGGLAHGRHWHGLINAYSDEPEIARCSPGDLLLRHVLGDLIGRGFATFDLGVGEARYKAALCDETIELVDAVVPVTALGHAFAAAERARLAAKRRIKQTPWALRTARRVQAFLGRS